MSLLDNVISAATSAMSGSGEQGKAVELVTQLVQQNGGNVGDLLAIMRFGVVAEQDAREALIVVLAIKPQRQGVNIAAQFCGNGGDGLAQLRGKMRGVVG